MTIRYKNEIADWMTASDWDTADLERWREYTQQELTQCYLLTVLVGAVIWMLAIEMLALIVVFVLLACTIMSIVIPKRTQNQRRAQWLDWLQEPQNADLLGERTLQISESDLFSSTSRVTSAIKWTAISQIKVIDEGAIIFMGTKQHLFVPRHRLIEGDFDPFIAEATRLRLAATNP